VDEPGHIRYGMYYLSSLSHINPFISFFLSLKFQLNYKPGAAATELARRYKHLAGAKIRTVGEAFAQFNAELGYTVNPLYKNMVTDLVGTTHLIVVNARFQRDPVWCLGIVAALELLLKNYPEKDVAAKIVDALFNSVGMNEADVRAEAKKVTDWVAAGQTKETIEAALSGQGQVGSPLAIVADAIKKDEYWMYSRYFGLGLVKIMEMIGIEMDKDEVYPIMEEWMSKKLGRSHLTACVSSLLPYFLGFPLCLHFSMSYGKRKSLTLLNKNCNHQQADSDLFFKVKDKLDMMETMMKEIEIREKKRMAERLEERAEAALRAADREVKMQTEIEAEAAASRTKVDV
jgi:Thylakoid formation protein